MREITKLTISILYLIFLLSVMCVQGSNVTGTLFQLTSKVTTCADIYARLLTKPLSNPLLGSLSYSDTQETILVNYIMYESGPLNNTCSNIQGTYNNQDSYYKIPIVTSIGLVITPVTVGGSDWLMWYEEGQRGIGDR